MNVVSARLQSIRPSPTMAISQQARDLRNAGENIVTLSMGEPDFDTPDAIRQAAIRAIMDGHTRYTRVDGIDELKHAVCAKFARDNALSYAPEQINVSPGGKAVIYNSLRASLDPGDQVILPAPYWVSYPDMIRLCDGVPVIVPTRQDHQFVLQPDALEHAITERTRWLILNSPGNPTGTVYHSSQLRALAAILADHPHVNVLCDDIYEHLVYDSCRFSTMAEACPDLFERTLTVNGVSKAYAMTGWRIGFAAGPRQLIAAMAKVMTQTTSSPCSVSQWAAIEALTGDQSIRIQRQTVFERRRDRALDILSQAPGVVCSRPQGAFYIFLLADGLIGRTSAAGRLLASDHDIASALLDEARVALVPGSAFGLAPALRLSYAVSDDMLEDGCRRIVSFCRQSS